MIFAKLNIVIDNFRFPDLHFFLLLHKISTLTLLFSLLLLFFFYMMISISFRFSRFFNLSRDIPISLLPILVDRQVTSAYGTITTNISRTLDCAYMLMRYLLATTGKIIDLYFLKLKFAKKLKRI